MAEQTFQIDLRAMRERRGFSISELAHLTKLNRANLYEIEAGRTKAIGLNVLTRLCHALNCTPSDLLKLSS